MTTSGQPLSGSMTAAGNGLRGSVVNRRAYWGFPASAAPWALTTAAWRSRAAISSF
jgi:hypothetical protein